MTIDRPGFSKDTFISAFEENAFYSDPMDRSSTHMTNPDNLRLTTRQYNDSVYRKVADALPTQAKIAKNDMKVECFDTYVGI